MTHAPHHAATSRDELQARLQGIERELLGLKRLLTDDSKELPAAAFHALELRIDEQSFLLPVEPIREVVQAVWPSPLPESPPWVRGTFRYGPLLLPMIDLGRRLIGRETQLSPNLTLIILEKPKRVGLLAPIPEGVVEIPVGVLSSPDPEISQSPWLVGTICSHSERGAHLLSVERLGREFVLASP